MQVAACMFARACLEIRESLKNFVALGALHSPNVLIPFCQSRSKLNAK